MQKSLILTLIILFFANVSISAQLAPNFTFTDTKGIEHNLYEDYLDNGKTVLIKIFFVNCPPCRAIAPATQDLYVEWGEGQHDVEFLEFSNKTFDSNADVAGYKNDFDITFPGAGFDGGAITALEPYINGTFGSFFGTPDFVIISPNRQVNFGVGGGGIINTINSLDAAIEATGAIKPIEEIEPSNFIINVKDAFGKNISDVDLVLTSGNSNANIPLTIVGNQISFQNFGEQYPGLTDPKIKISKTNNVIDKLSALDLLVIIKHILLLEPISDPVLLKAADVNNDNIVNSVDLLVIQRVILQLIPTFPAVDSYQFIPNEISLDIIPGATQQIDFSGFKTGDLNGF